MDKPPPPPANDVPIFAPVAEVFVNGFFAAALLVTATVEAIKRKIERPRVFDAVRIPVTGFLIFAAPLLLLVAAITGIVTGVFGFVFVTKPRRTPTNKATSAHARLSRPPMKFDQPVQSTHASSIT